MKNLCQKVSLPDEWREKFLTKLENESMESHHTSGLFIQNLRNNISSIKEKLERLTDAYLAEVLELAEYQERKNILMAEKKTIEEKLSDFERKGNHWLELAKNWILESNQAVNLALTDDYAEMKNFLKKIGSNPRLSAGVLSVSFQNPWRFLAETPSRTRAFSAGEVNFSSNSDMWTRQDLNLPPPQCK